MAQKGAHIVAIDDSDIAQDFIRATLADLGFDNVTGFMDPVEALDAFGRGDARADLILLDIMMPGIDGIELCARIRGLEGWQDVPIIMLTSRSDMASLSQAFLAGANDYVTKPFDRIELQARMRSCLRLKSELDRRRSDPARDRRRHEGQGPSPSILPGLLCGRAGIQASLLALSAERARTLGLVVFRIDGEAGARGGADEDRGGDADGGKGHDMGHYRGRDMACAAQVADVLGRVDTPAAEIFAHWEDDLFCLAVPDARPEQLHRRAEQFREALFRAKLRVRDGWSSRSLSLSACIVMPGSGDPAAALAQGIRDLDKAGYNGQTGAILTASQIEKNP